LSEVLFIALSTVQLDELIVEVEEVVGHVFDALPLLVIFYR